MNQLFNHKLIFFVFAFLILLPTTDQQNIFVDETIVTNHQGKNLFETFSESNNKKKKTKKKKIFIFCLYPNNHLKKCYLQN